MDAPSDLPLGRYWLAVSLIAILLSGCGQGDDGPVTARDGGYEVAIDDSSTDAGTSAGSQPNAASPSAAEPQPPTAGDPADAAEGGASGQPKTGQANPNAVAASSIPTPPTTPPISPSQPPAGQPEGQPTGQPSAQPPETEQELLDYLQQLQMKTPTPATPDLMMAEMQQIQVDRIVAAEKLAALATDQRSKVAAAQTKLEALRRLSSMGSSETLKQLNAYSRELQNGDDPELAMLGRITRFALALDDLAAGNQQDATAILAELKSLVQAEGVNPGVFMVTSDAAELLHQMGRRQEALEAYQAVGEAFQGSEDAELATAAKQLLQGAAELKLELKFDFRSKVQQLLTGDADAVPAMIDAVTKMLSDEDLGPVQLNMACQAGQLLEMSNQGQAADQIFNEIEQRYQNHADEALAKAATERVKNRQKRAALVGQPLVIEGMQQEGRTFNWQDYRGKVVAVYFWVTWSEPCLLGISNLLQNYRGFHEKGFDVVGICLDEDPAMMKRFLDVQPLPWPNLASTDPEASGLQTPLAIECGVDMLPFLVLVGQDGNVVSLHTSDPKLEQRLTQLLGPPAASTGAQPGGALPGTPTPEAPASSAPAPPASTPPAAAQPAPAEAVTPPASTLPETIPAPGNSSSTPPATQPETFFVAWLQDPETPDEASDIDRSVSPYAPRAGLSNAELIDFIFDMQDKPTSIQRRPGFAEAIALAADRILAGQPTDKHCELAAEAKFAALHAAACRGDEGADQQLAEFAKQTRDHRLKKIADRAQFFLLEQKTVQADELPLDAIPALLEELAAYLADRSLDESHLRLASSTVHAINRLEDEDQREEYFQKFGETFAKSSSKDLARYGKKLAKSPEQKQPDLIGKPLELAGVTALGTKLDWESYRGKVVLVDFWATWCGPCRKAMPEVKAYYDQLHERGFDIVGISLDRTAEALAKYLDENEIVWTNVFGEDATKLAERYGVRGIPMMMLVDRQGTVVAAGHQLEPLKAKIMELLNES